MGKKHTKKPTLLSSVADKFMSLDMFGETLTFTIDSADTYPSLCGTIVSLAIFALVLPYGAHKFTTMWEYGDTSHQDITDENSISAYTLFPYEKTHANLMVKLFSMEPE